MFLNKKKKTINVTEVGHKDSGIFEDDELCWLYSAPTYTAVLGLRGNDSVSLYCTP